MLEPGLRQVYLEALRPPLGFRLDRAIGTTYSLDLLALLVAPLSFALFDCDGWEDALRDPVALLEALERNAERITLFCQIGEIKVPDRHHVLYAKLEPMVVQVRAPAPGGVFHPKTWTLRYVDDAARVHYRFLCLSRNLTFDRSWDIVFAEEGQLTGHTWGYATLDPLGDFLAALPSLAVEQPVEQRIADDVAMIQAEIRRADLRLPPDSPFDADDVRFWPLGIDGYRSWPFAPRADRFLVVSPFLSDGAVDRFAQPGRGDILVSTSESVDALAETTRELFGQLLVMGQDTGADLEAVATGDTAVDDAEPPILDRAEPPVLDDGHSSTPSSIGHAEATEFSGLHAKLFIGEYGTVARVWVGSANATAAALLHRGGAAQPGRNVEFLVELAGPRRRVGIDAFLGRPPTYAGFRDLLVPWQPGEPPGIDDRVAAALDERLRLCVDAIARAEPRLRAEGVGSDVYDLVLWWGGMAPPEMADTAGICWPITLPQARARALAGPDVGAETRFTQLSTVGLSRFMAFELTASDGAARRRMRFVLNLPLEGAPEDRGARILQSLLENRGQFLRYLLLLLADDDGFGDGGKGNTRVGDGGSSELPLAGLQGLPLLEELIRALARHPERIGRVKRMVDDLRRTEHGRALLPDGFDEVWLPIEATWREGARP